MKVVPSLIWENDDRPEAFHGTVTINATSELAATADKQEAITATSNQTMQAVQLMHSVPSRISSTESIHVDSLDAVFNIFGLDNTLSPATEDQIVMESVKPITADQVDKPVISGPNGFVQPSGEHFIQWLKDAILNKKLIINDAHAFVYPHDTGNSMNKLHPFSTISSVVKDLIAHMSIEEQQRIAQFKQDELIRLHFSWGA